MSLTIEDEATCDLARELAELTGETVPDAVTIALRERLQRERVGAMMAIAARVAPHLRGEPSVVTHYYLYDERGLPK